MPLAPAPRIEETKMKSSPSRGTPQGASHSVAQSNPSEPAQVAPQLVAASQVRETPFEDLPERTKEMGVANMTFLVERLFADTAPGQFVRELTQNGLEAIGRLSKARGQVIWTIERRYFQKGLAKLCCIDTGIGMTGPEMVKYINALAESSHQQSTMHNFGVGAKIAGAPRNKEGMLYLSWKDGRGAMVNLWKNPQTGVYGLRQLKRADGTYDFWAPVPDALMPDPIKEGGGRGTMVVLLGNTMAEDTTAMPTGMQFPKRWILRYLNGRFFRFPDGADVRVHEGWNLPDGDKHNFLRRVTGLENWLDENTESKGMVELTGAKVHWWILRADVDRNSGHTPTPGLVGALWQDELYDLVAAGRAGTGRLHHFGVIFGTDRVALVVEPAVQAGIVGTNTARTTLLLNGEPLPWAEWASEFRGKLPEELQALMEDIGSKASSIDVRQNIRERLKAIRELFLLSRYRRVKGGSLTVDPGSMITPDEPTPVEFPVGEIREMSEPSRPPRPTRIADLYATLVAAAEEGLEAESVVVREMPDPKWISKMDGTRSDDYLEDKAAEYLRESNKLMINADFRVFADMEHRWLTQFKAAPAADTAVRETVREWFTQQLIEAVMTAKALEGSPQWSQQEIEELWSPTALTAVALPRYHIDREVGRILKGKFAAYLKESA